MPSVKESTHKSLNHHQKGYEWKGPRRHKSDKNRENYLGIEPLPPEPKKRKDPKVISFELKVPKIKKTDFPYKPIAKIMPWALVGIFLLIAIILGVKHYDNPRSTSGVVEENLPASPAFETLVPETAKKVEDKPVSYDPEKQVASFKDKITGVDVTISQQALPDTFKANPEQEVEKLAKNFNANKIIYAGEVKAFSGISSEDKTQTVVFTKKNLLIFVRAVKELDKDGLVQYIINLE